MSILVTGATGTIGSLIVQRLADAGADVKALVRHPGKLSLPAGVTARWIVCGPCWGALCARMPTSSKRPSPRPRRST
jgi:NAD(P)-dependent dehydrogenase (short-subunit alcohol dehydrogenase family)